MHLIKENVLKNYFNEKLCILRPTLIYGKKDPHNGYGPNKFLRKITSNQSIDLFGKGEKEEIMCILMMLWSNFIMFKKKFFW